MLYILIVQRFELYMDFALYKIYIYIFFKYNIKINNYINV